MNEYTDYLRQKREFDYDITRSICVNIEKKLIYYKPGRAAGTTIFRNKLQPMGGWIIKKDNPKAFNNWLNEIADKELKLYYTFIFARNTFDRLVSAWNVLDKKRYSNFKDFVRGGLMFDKNGHPIELHYQLQSSLIETPLKIGPELSFIGRVESVQNDWDVLCEILEFPYSKLGHHHKSDHLPCNTYYDKETIKLVQKMYARDLEIFGYKNINGDII